MPDAEPTLDLVGLADRRLGHARRLHQDADVLQPLRHSHEKVGAST